MARPSLLFALVLSIAGLSSTAVAAPEADADQRLAAEATALPTPSLRTRLKARAAAYRVVLQTAEQLGFDEAAVGQVARAQQAPLVVAARTTERD